LSCATITVFVAQQELLREGDKGEIGEGPCGRFMGGSMDGRKQFFDSSATVWDEKFARNNRPEILAQVAEWFGAQTGEAILDVGTGTGVLLPFLSRAVGEKGKVVAMDFAFNMLKAGLSRTYEVSPVFINAGVGAIPFRRDSFDKVTCFSAFPHFPDKGRALCEMVRVLKKGGMVFVAHLHSIEEIAELHGNVGEAVRKDHLPDRQAMVRLMEKAGLSGIDIINEPGKFFAQGQKN
jgi:ubiquinone/menaquinone biosynthesis C-methylase UbiE